VSRQRINPNKIIWHHDDLNEDAVAHYMEHPDKPYDGDSGTVEIEIGKNGQMYGANGRHRAEAARRTGRKLEANVVNNPERTQAFSNPGCLGLIMLVAVLLVSVLLPLLMWS